MPNQYSEINQVAFTYDYTFSHNHGPVEHGQVVIVFWVERFESIVLFRGRAASKISDDSLTLLCINCQVNFHANAGWCRAEGHDVTCRRPPLVAACILKPLHDCYSHYWELCCTHVDGGLHNGLTKGKYWCSRDTKSPKPWSPTDTSKWRSLSPDSWCFSDEGLYVSNIASFKKRFEHVWTVSKSTWVGWFLHPEKEWKGIQINPFTGPQESSCLSFKWENHF